MVPQAPTSARAHRVAHPCPARARPPGVWGRPVDAVRPRPSRGSHLLLDAAAARGTAGGVQSASAGSSRRLRAPPPRLLVLIGLTDVPAPRPSRRRPRGGARHGGHAPRARCRCRCARPDIVGRYAGMCCRLTARSTTRKGPWEPGAPDNSRHHPHHRRMMFGAGQRQRQRLRRRIWATPCCAAGSSWTDHSSDAAITQ